MRQNRTDLQKAASRANGRKSKGPTTQRGKAASSRNALKHGLSAHSIVLPNERRQDYNELTRWLYGELAPQTPLEIILVQRMVEAQWKLQRVATFERVSMIHAASALPHVLETVTAEGTWHEPAARDALAFTAIHGKAGTGSVFQISQARYFRQFAQALSQLNMLMTHRTASQLWPKSLRWSLVQATTLSFRRTRGENSRRGYRAHGMWR